MQLTTANVALVFFFGCACFHSMGKYFYLLYRLVFGTLLPAYNSYKAVKNKDVREYSRWMMYWIVFAFFSVAEVFTDIFVAFWLPFYYEMKIFFVLWLMSPYGNGSKIMYLTTIHPQLSRYEQTIDLYIDSGKQLAVQSVGHLWSKIAQVINHGVLCLFQTAQTLLFHHHLQSQGQTPMTESQRLLTQANPSNGAFFHQFFMPRSQQIIANNQSEPDGQSASTSADGSPVTQNQPLYNQRWFSTETINIMDISELTPSSPICLRVRSESESHLNLLESMEVEVEGRPPVQPNRKKKAKTANASPGERVSGRKPRAAAIKARAKCKKALPEEY